MDGVNSLIWQKYSEASADYRCACELEVSHVNVFKNMGQPAVQPAVQMHVWHWYMHLLPLPSHNIMIELKIVHFFCNVKTREYQYLGNSTSKSEVTLIFRVFTPFQKFYVFEFAHCILRYLKKTWFYTLAFKFFPCWWLSIGLLSNRKWLSIINWGIRYDSVLNTES